MVDLNRLFSDFREAYRSQPRVFSAPGRVNIIGEHTDYNEGFVLPMAIDRRTYVVVSARTDNRVRIRSLGLNRETEFAIDNPVPLREEKWANYAAGVAWILKKRGIALSGANIMIDSDVPIGGGLSSSAALEIATGAALTALASSPVELLDLAGAGQQAEHDFVGAKVGLMDQLCATMGKRDHALLIDCRSLDTKTIPLSNLSAAIVVCNTNVKHDLAASAYNERRAECEQGVELLRKKMPQVRALRDVSVAQFEEFESDLPEPIRRRCRHVVTEDDRTLKAAEALARGEREELGELMRQSHESLRDDYQVSCRELDLMVDIARDSHLVFGARMTGGGFGGCTINLVRPDYIDEFSELMKKKYHAATDVAADVYVVKAGDGVREETRP